MYSIMPFANSERGLPFSFLREKSQVFTVKYGVNCELVIYDLYCVEVCFPLCTFRRIFTINSS